MKYDNYCDDGAHGINLDKLTVETEDGRVELCDLHGELPEEERRDIKKRAGNPKILLAELICVKTKIHQLTPRNLLDAFTSYGMSIDRRRYELMKVLDGGDKIECKAYIARERCLLRRLDKVQCN